jgi:hypothetical protein
MVAHRIHVGPRLVDTGMDHALAVEPHVGLFYWLRVERKFENVFWLHQLRRTRSRHQIALWVSRMAHGDMTESVEYAFVRNHAVRAGEQFTRFV